MSDRQNPAQFENEQLPEFLEHIAREEARELERLRGDFESAARAIRTGARRESRNYHHRVCEEVRTRIESEHMRKLSRARNELRRRRWEMLQDLRGRAREKIYRQLRQRWRIPERQATWCLYWLAQCEHFEDCDEIEIRVGGDIQKSTIAAIGKWTSDHGWNARVEVDESLSAGILIHHGKYSIDGLLDTQLEHLLGTIQRELAVWLHDENDARGKRV